MSSLSDPQEGMCIAAFGPDPSDDVITVLIPWLHDNLFNVPVDKPVSIMISSEHILSHTFGVTSAETILAAPYVPAKLRRTGEYSFVVECEEQPHLDMLCNDCDDVTDLLLTNFALLYFKPGSEDDALE
eukprot:5440678-Pleurochrysis_carterae.AAC.1